jgi:hypothetical protein
MHRSELIEWIISIACILLWWPRIFSGYDPVWYHLVIYYLVPLTLLVIFFRRYGRMKAGLKYSEDSLKNLPPGPGAGPG